MKLFYSTLRYSLYLRHSSTLGTILSYSAIFAYHTTSHNLLPHDKIRVGWTILPNSQSSFEQSFRGKQSFLTRDDFSRHDDFLGA